MNDPGITRGEILGLVIRLSFASVVTFLSVRWLLKYVDPSSNSKRQARKVAEEQLKRINSNRSKSQISNLTDYELMIAAHLISPQDIKVSWDDIAGLNDLIRDLRETVILPIQQRDLFAYSELTTAPKGVLLHGPPGCGKTLIAKATAREAGTYFINLDLSILTDKWYGESQKLAAAVFSLAIKLQPCIIFIDEIDSFLRARSSTDHEATAMMKAQFMSLWDGLITDPNVTIIIMGATNRPQDLDRAILRRLPATFHVPLPNVENRRQILNLILEHEDIADDVNIQEIANITDGFSGSDLHELCRNAAVNRIRSYFRDRNESNASGSDNRLMCSSNNSETLRPINKNDLMLSYRKMAESKRQCNPFTAHQPRIELD